jgi:hypothetical protein
LKQKNKKQSISHKLRKVRSLSFLGYLVDLKENSLSKVNGYFPEIWR